MQPVSFKNIFKGKTVIVGIGNTLRRDDGLGPTLVKKLKGRVKALCLDAGMAPENYTGKIAKEKPDTVLLVDALHLNRAPGEYELLKKEDILSSGFSTHDLSPRMFIEYLEKNTSADIYLLGIEPKSVAFGEGLSVEVEMTLEELEKLICKVSNA